MIHRSSRRGFLQSAGAAASLPVLFNSLFSSSAKAGTLAVRRNVGNMSASDPVLLTYRKAIKAMKALPPSDPRSWSYQAAIHGTFTTPALTAWNTCQHNSLFFWSWHRMYLYWFERIVRQMAGECEDCWCLPYWDWASATQRKLPAPFRDTASELFESNRNAAMNTGAGSLSGAVVDLSGCWPMTDFVLASGAFSGPHGAVHVSIGGLMGQVPSAAQDPIFYLHHANVDRQWNLWLAQGGRSDPLGDATWKNTKYTFFDEHGVEVAMTSCQVLRAAEQLSYVYESEPDQVKQYCERHRFPWIWELVDLRRFEFGPIKLTPAPTSVDLSLADLQGKLAGFGRSEDQLLLLQLDDIVADQSPGIVWEVHLGATDAKQLNETSPSFLGVVALFGDGVRNEKHGDHGFSPAHFAFPIRAAALQRIARGPARVRLTFIPRGILIDDKPGPLAANAAAQIGGVRLSIQTRKAADKD
jgi:Common central domain of tyrosinase/Polyphenol oxidase middle domain